MSNIKVYVSGLSSFADSIKQAHKRMDTFLDSEIGVLSADLMSGSVEHTPVGVYDPHVEFDAYKGTDKETHVSFTAATKAGGTLQRNWKVSTPVRIKSGRKSEIYNDSIYASYVNDGHRIVNKDKEEIGWYEGQHFMEDANQEFENGIEKRLTKDVANFFKGGLNGNN